MQLFNVTIKGDALQIEDSDGKTIKELIKENGVYLIADHNRKTIFLYRGIEAGILLQFMGTKVQKEMKMQVRGFFSTEDISEQSDVNTTYQEVMSSQVTWGNIDEIHHKEEQNEEEQGEEEQGELTDTQRRIKLEIESRARETCIHKGVTAKDVIPKIKDLENPLNYHRNMTLIGNSVYREEKVITSFLIDQKESIGLKKIGALPNGFFFLEDISSRIIIRKGRVQALDFMIENDKFLGLDKVMAPVLKNERISKEGDVNQLLNSFGEKKEENEESRADQRAK